MKKLLVVASLLISSLSFADITISKPTLNGFAIELPDGTLGISNPTLTINNKEFFIEAYSFSSDNTLRIACALIHKKFIVAEYEKSNGSFDSIQIDINGIITMNAYDINSGAYFVKTLICK